jgi:uncharacterized damage-inducible protein DinB
MNTAHSTALRHLEYHAWATAKTIESVSPLSHEELLRDMKTAHSSVWGTLEHIYRADNLWLKRLNGAIDAKISDDEAVSDLSDLQSKWQVIQAQLISFAGSLSNTGLERVMEYRLLSGDQTRSAVYESLLQVVNHGTYHRGQIAAMLRQLGAVPIPTDFIRFVWAIKDK